MSNFFDDDDDGGDSQHLDSVNGAADDFFFTQPAAGGGGTTTTESRAGGAAGRVSSVSGRAGGGSSVRGSSVFDARDRDSGAGGRARGGARAGGGGGRGDSPTLEEILGEEPVKGRERNVQKLIRAWNNEIGSPELLVFPRQLVERVAKDLATRKALVRKANLMSGKDEGFYVMLAIVATENMRAAHVLKSFTRERIHKVEKHARYYLSNMEDASERMYHNEIAHAQGIIHLEETYYRTAAMDAMPQSIQRLDEEHMISAPDMAQAVFLNVRQNCGPVVLPDGTLLELQKGTRHMCRYSTIRDLLRRDLVELI